MFEMKALFCESRGPNFRHRLAHGLLESRISVLFLQYMPGASL